MLGKERVFAYEQWDVFSAVPLKGNQLAVFQDGGGLSPDEMLAITREMNFSESTFILPQALEVERERGVKVRIFTRGGEVPFAGHPALGTAISIFMRRQESRVVLDLPAGQIPVTFEKMAQGIYGEMVQTEPVFAEVHAPERIAPLLGIPVSEIVSGVPVENVSTGRPNLIVLLKSLAAVRSVKMNWAEIERYFAAGDRQRGFYLLTREVEDRSAVVHARKLTSAGEDPATGSAAGCAAAWMVKHGLAESGSRIGIEQGSEMHRPGMLIARASRVGEKIVDVRVGGFCVKVGTGELRLP